MTTLDRPALLAEADVLLVLAGLLTVKNQHVVDDLRALADLGEALAQRIEPGDAAGLVPGLRRLAKTADELTWEELRLENARLHDGPVACPINETAYVRRDKGSILADVSGFYRAFGLAHNSSGGEKLDHLGTELEFVALLLILEAQALEQGRSRERMTTQAAANAFVNDHLNAFIGSFCERLHAAAGTEFHRTLALQLQDVWRAFCARRGISAEQAQPPQPAEGDELAFDCGGCEAGQPE